jgi:hypothetical protein
LSSGSRPSAAGEQLDQLAQAAARRAERDPGRSRFLLDVPGAQAQFEPAVGEAPGVGDLPGQVGRGEHRGVQHVGAQGRAAAHVGRGGQGRERRGGAEVVGHLEYVVAQILDLVDAGASRGAGTDLKEADTETEGTICHAR